MAWDEPYGAAGEGALPAESGGGGDVLLHGDAGGSEVAGAGGSHRCVARAVAAGADGAAVRDCGDGGVAGTFACALDVAGRRCGLFRALAGDQGGGYA